MSRINELVKITIAKLLALTLILGGGASFVALLGYPDRYHASLGIPILLIIIGFYILFVSPFKPSDGVGNAVHSREKVVHELAYRKSKLKISVPFISSGILILFLAIAFQAPNDSWTFVIPFLLVCTVYLIRRKQHKNK